MKKLSREEREQRELDLKYLEQMIDMIETTAESLDNARHETVMGNYKTANSYTDLAFKTIEAMERITKLGKR